MSSCSSISSSFRLFTTKMSTSSFLPHRSPNPQPFLFWRRITFERIAAASPPPLSVSASSPSPTSLQAVEEELPPKLREIVRLFQSVQEPKAKYEQLLFYGKNLKPLDDVHKTRRNKVDGCVSQVWVRAYLDSERNVVYEADSDSVLTKGLAALLVNGLSGRPAEEVVRISPEFVVLLGLQQSLTPSRNNGFLNMLKLMQRKALELLVEAENAKESPNSKAKTDFGGKIESFEGRVGVETSERREIGSNSELRSSDEVEISGFGKKSEGSAVRTGARSEIGANMGNLGSRGMRIREKLEKELNPVELEVEDISYQHAGHAGVRGNDDGETHFNVRIVSKEFEGKSLVKRHRLVYGLLQEELQSGLHALSIVAKTPSEVGELAKEVCAMEKVRDDRGLGVAKIEQGAPPPPPPPPPLPWFWAGKVVTESLTKQEIAKFWRQKRIKEEEHLLAAIKAAARIRARNLSEEDYNYFEESLKDEGEEDLEKNTAAANDGYKEQSGNEIRVGIKDWWTKSKYAYLNQPAIESKRPPKRRTSTYVPNCISYKPTPLYPTSLGVF